MLRLRKALRFCGKAKSNGDYRLVAPRIPEPGGSRYYFVLPGACLR